MTESRVGEQEVEVVSLKKPFMRRTRSGHSKSGSSSSPKKSGRLIKLALVMVLVFGIYWLFIRSSDSKVVNTEGNLTQITQVTSSADAAKRYSEDYAQATNTLKQARTSKWDRETLDKAYFSLLYADKIGAYIQVQNTLFLIESVERGGMNIDDNSYGVTKEIREQISNRAKANAQKAMNGGTN